MQIILWHISSESFSGFDLISCKSSDRTPRTQQFAYCNKCQYPALSSSDLGWKFIPSCSLPSGAVMRPGTTMTGATEMDVLAISTSMNWNCLGVLPGAVAGWHGTPHIHTAKPSSSPIQGAARWLPIPDNCWTITGNFWQCLLKRSWTIPGITNNLMVWGMEPGSVESEMCLGAVWFTSIGIAFLLSS